MSFWSFASGPTWWQATRTLWSTQQPERLEGPDTPQLHHIPRLVTEQDIPALLAFWAAHFKGGQGPLIGYSTTDLQNIITSPQYTLLIVLSSGQIIGSIMARHMGSWTRTGMPASNQPFPTSWIDMFCVHADHRHNQVGRSLLFSIYAHLKSQGRESSLFLKEGAPLMLPPICSSFFTWRRVRPEEQATNVHYWDRATLNDWITLQQPSNTIINSAEVQNTLIVAYAAQNAWIVAAFSPAHQRHPEDSAALIWMTGYLADGPVRNQEKKEAMRQLSVAAARHFSTHWIWVDGFHAPPDAIWNRDGLYHIYAFNWNPGVFFNGNPFIIF